jgi:phosphoglycerate dehydrogenase-like enzyme
MAILVTDPIAQDGIDYLQQHVEVDVRLGLKPDELCKILPAYEGLVVRSETKVTADVIAAGTKLLVIGRAGVGVDNIDVDAATQRGIVVVNAPAGNTIPSPSTRSGSSSLRRGISLGLPPRLAKVAGNAPSSWAWRSAARRWAS